jgi:tetratricopeptide (TPR) repeat protein/TolB-like protein
VRKAEIRDLVAGIVDGSRTPPGIEPSLTLSTEEREFLEGLRLVADVAHVHQSQPLQPDDVPSASTTQTLVAAFAAALHEASSRLLQPEPEPAPLEAFGTAPAWPGRPRTDALHGDTWGGFRLVEKVGAGSYGDVYRAWDMTLAREVAVKLLRPGAASSGRLSRRVREEGRALARITHQNVVTVHGVEEHDGRVGLIMEFLRGRTLEDQLESHGRFGAQEATLVGQEICKALAAVHGAGIVHRDVKTRNVMRVDGGRVVLMDFGAGEPLNDKGESANARPTGTPLYVAPEVLDGAPATAQSDLYSLGVLLFRLVTADYPFKAATLDELRTAWKTSGPRPIDDLRPDLPQGFSRAVERALRPNPVDRFPSVGAFSQALARALDEPRPPAWRRRALVAGLAIALATGAGWLAIRPPSDGARPQQAAGFIDIAVAPIRDVAREGSALASQLTEDLVTSLASLDRVRVKGAMSLAQVRPDTDLQVRDIATRLGVRWVIAGYLGAGPRGRTLTLRVLDADSEAQQWTHTEPLSASLAPELPEAMIRAMAAVIGGVASTSPVIPRHGQNADAQAAYLEASALLRNWNPTAQARARTLLDHAIHLDAGYADAYAALGRLHLSVASTGVPDQEERYKLAADALTRALTLNPALTDARVSYGDLLLNHDWDWTRAGDEYRQAVETNPSHIQARFRYAMYLCALSRFDEAIEQGRTAAELDDVPAVLHNLALVHFYARQYDEAIAFFKRRLAAEPGLAQTHFSLGRAQAVAGDYPSAIAELTEAVELSGGFEKGDPDYVAELARTLADSGNTSEATRLLDGLLGRTGLPRVTAHYLAYAYMGLRDFDRAFAALDQAIEDRAPTLLWAAVQPRFDPVRGDSRFERLLSALRLPSGPGGGEARPR